MTFFRYQEFYESKYDAIREKSFTLVQQMGLYCREYLQDCNATWSYDVDWSGYNIPVETIKQVHDLGIPDPNHFDSFMLAIHDMIMIETLGQSAYLIGTSQMQDDGILKHEFTHAMFYINDDYREDVLRTFLNDATNELLEELVAAMAKQNYPRKTAFDEINAYITTGESGFFDEVKLQDELDELRQKLKALHKPAYKSFMAQEIE